MNRIAFCTFGCRINQYDTETIRTLLEQTGHFHTVSPRQVADIYVVNTCSVTAQADATARKAIRKIKNEHPAAKIVVTGCYAQRVPTEIAKLPGVALVLGVPDRTHIAAEIQHILADTDIPDDGKYHPSDREPSQRIAVSPVSTARSFPEVPITRMMSRSRAVVKIQDGCNGACSFCIIPQTRGHSRSRQPDRVIEQISQLVDNGHREIVLAGVHLGEYGLDLGQGPEALPALIEKILAIPGLIRFRLSSIGLGAISDAIIQLMATEEKFARYFHIPLQSASDEILVRMNRGYLVAQFEELLHKITDTIPDCGIGTDIICGFPGESEALFNETVKRISTLPLSYLHPFPYSVRPGSTAESFADQVPGEHRKSRTRILKQVSREKNWAFQHRHLGRLMPVLVEDARKSGEGTPTYLGWTDNYLRVTVSGARTGSGLQTVQISAIGEEGLIGSIVEGG